MALFTGREKKNEKEEKDLQAEMNARKVSLEDEQLGSVAGGEIPDFWGGYGKDPSGDGWIVETDILKKFGT
jgi:hypothetical protein